MNQETHNCQNCKNQFMIEPDDFVFYKKMQVPPPTFCPLCRIQRRFAWRNEWRLFKKKESLSNKPVFSIFSPESPAKIYENSYWWSDEWDPMAYGREYDWSKPFFVQFAELLDTVPLPARPVFDIVNSDYSINANGLKNCYLVSAAGYTEDSAYVIWDTMSKNSLDLHMTEKCELCYWGVNLARCYKTFFSVNCEDCQESWFLKNCVGCSHCFGCMNLRNKSYYIFNQPYNKDKYFKKLEGFNLDSWESLQTFQNQIEKLWQASPNKFTWSRHNTNVSGDYVYNSKNSFYCYRAREVEDSKYCQNIMGRGYTKDCYDYTNWGENSELIYDSILCGNKTYKIKFSWNAYLGNKDLEYCAFCHSSSNLFGCVALRKKQFCIFNKQYSKEKYENLVLKIKEHMNQFPYVDKRGLVYRYGEFFPIELSPYEYNITIAQEFFPLDQKVVLNMGYKWKSPEEKEYTITVHSENLPVYINEVDDSITKETIGCSHKGECNEQCTTAFKIIPEELQYYKKMNLPLPRLCPNCRHYERLKQRNPLKLYKRKCQCTGEKSENGVYNNKASHPHHNSDHCPNSFQTTYAPDREEIIYCEQCYQQEVA